MKRFRLTYNGIVSEFNGYEIGRGGTVTNGQYSSHFIKFSVRPSKTNTMKISNLIQCFDENGNITWHFNSRNYRGSIPRGLKVFVEIIS